MATTNAEVSRLLVLGPDKDSKLAVIGKLRELCGDSDPAVSDPKSADVTVLNLQTKYYRAPVEVHVHRVLDNEPEPALQHELHDYEAVMCVVDAGQRESFLHVHRFAKRIVDVLPYDVCLLVAGTSSATTDNVKKMESWCQDNGFEFVDLDGEQGEPSDDSVIDEKRGIERVLEALHCNMWRSMEMNPAPTATTSKVTKDATPEVAVEDAAEAEQKTENPTDVKENNAAVDAETENQDSADDDSRLQALLQALEIAGGPDADGDAGGEGDDDDLDMAEFSALISEVRNVRDQGQSLTDEQRRERAAEVAMKLWNFLGADDEDGADSD
ncbi:unnamed protein product [Phytophthora lilii]|uniref:Unnamed protein product n=1 Tax=Phytophthora lilii TaxID=2077276 RepID=A0A9W6UBH4_9STRA|nr:unnamed protein product [Phytophthora lilii]